MKQTPKKQIKVRTAPSEIDARFLPVVEAFALDRTVSLGDGKGFGSGALKVNGRIFAMMSSKNAFVVKLPRERVEEMVAAGKGEPFNTRRGRVMKEWLVGPTGSSAWVELAREAYRFVKTGKA
jgi:hypothetical protein